MNLKKLFLCVAFPYAAGVFLGYKHKQEENIRKDIAHDLTDENIEAFVKAIS